MNNIITVPKKGEFVLIPKKEYEEFNMLKKAVQIRKGEEWFWTPEWQKKELEADQDIVKGKVSGPFFSARDLIGHLKKTKIRSKK
ncbi:MAG: AbrB/MazE/SpoVT family DNA-binding domain-containing protein [Candidatus Giovannonibacteria bacterium]|nr:MAG: AbrB/MazE/SpoVT family DNA-binding domain-containing protein [Candidatus Giovannonibacteria bacterium]